MNEPNAPKPTTLEKMLEWVVDVDVLEQKQAVSDLRQRNPDAGKEDLAKLVFRTTGWKAAATGMATGLPTNPWIAAPAAMADTALMLRMQITAAARAALVYDPDFFADDRAKWEILIPVFGLDVTRQFLRELGMQDGIAVTREMIRAHLTKQSWALFRSLLLKYLGMLVARKGSSMLLPVLGGLIGSAWNYSTIRRLEARCLTYFGGKPLDPA